jgi:hypothetical protein
MNPTHRQSAFRLTLFAAFLLCLSLCGCQPYQGDDIYGAQSRGFTGAQEEAAPQTAEGPESAPDRTTASAEAAPASGGGAMVIPARSQARWTARGNCMDPDRPAPRHGDKFRLIPINRLLDPELVPLYQSFINLTAHDAEAQRYQQQIVWAMRTVNQRRSYASSLGPAQRALLDKSHPGGAALFDGVRQSRVGQEGAMDFLAGMLPRISFFGFSIDPAELLNPSTAPAVADNQLEHLINASPGEPLRDTGYEQGRLARGIETTIVGTAPLTMTVTITNNSDTDYVFVPSAWVAEAQRHVQRVTLAPPRAARITKL